MISSKGEQTIDQILKLINSSEDKDNLLKIILKLFVKIGYVNLWAENYNSLKYGNNKYKNILKIKNKIV